jgi:hypothetical protein
MQLQGVRSRSVSADAGLQEPTRAAWLGKVIVTRPMTYYYLYPLLACHT